MKILHIVPGLNEPNNGIAVAAKLIAAEQLKSGNEVEVVDTREFAFSSARPSTSFRVCGNLGSFNVVADDFKGLLESTSGREEARPHDACES